MHQMNFFDILDRSMLISLVELSIYLNIFASSDLFAAVSELVVERNE